MRRWPLLLLALLLLVPGVAACGGDDDVDVDKVLQETFGADKDIKSGRLDLDLRLDARGLASLQGPVRVRLAGPFASSGADQLPRFALEATLDAGGQSIRAGATATADKGFLSFQGQSYVLSDELFKQFRDGYAEEAKKSQGDDKGISFKTLGIDPRRWLTDPQYEGKDDVGGAESLHIRSGIDVPRLLEDVNRILGRAEQIEGAAEQARELTAEERKQISDAIKDAKLDLWTGEDDKILRRLVVELEFDVPEQARQQANGLTGGTLRFQLGLGGINEDVRIEAPANAKPFEDLLATLGGGTQSGESSDSGAPPPGEPGSPYEKCVQEAGADISKLQECAGLSQSG
jgi:hypothetical protein